MTKQRCGNGRGGQHGGRAAPAGAGVAALPARTRALRAMLMAGAALPALAPASTGLAQVLPAPTTLPTGGRVIAGHASIAQSGSTLTVTQTTGRSAVNWDSFSVGSAGKVEFRTPTTTSSTLNRVVGPDPSVIAGQIKSNGQVILVNQSGVTFTQGAVVDVQSLVVTAAGITEANAKAGRMVFDQAPRPGARVENRGTITVAQTGLAALVAPQVANSGVIRARMGRVVLAGAEAHTVDLYGDGLLNIEVTKQVTQVPTGRDGKSATALVTNSGVVVADGGSVLLTASAVDGIVTNLVTAGGRVQADTLGSRTGTVTIAAQGGGATVTGAVNARGRGAGTKGGEIEINAPGRTVKLTPGARVDASGKAGGGTVAVGTTLARAKAKGGGKVSAPTARTVSIAPGASVRADATAKGDGGNVTVLSAGGTTTHRGRLSAKGGPRGGDGGFVEVSGDHFTFDGFADVSAPRGAAGSILLDPTNIVIGTPGPLTPPDILGAPAGGTFTADDDPGTTFLTPASIRNNMSGAVTIETGAGGLLTVAEALDVRTKTGGAPSSITDLTLSSKAGLVINAPVVGKNNITLLASDAGAGVSVNAGVSTTGNNKTITIDAAGAVVLAGNVSAGSSGTVTINAGAGGVAQNGGTLIAETLTSGTGITGSVALIKAGNQIAKLGAMTVTAGDLLLVNSAAAFKITGAVALGAGQTASFATDTLSFNGGTIAAGRVEIAPRTQKMSLGGTNGSDLAVVQGDLAGITATALQLGTATAGGATAASVTLRGNLDTSAFAVTRIGSGGSGIALASGTLTAKALDLTTTGGGVTAAGGTKIVADSLGSSLGIAGSVGLDGANAIGALGDLTVTGGTLFLRDTANLEVSGAVAATSVTLIGEAAAGTAIKLAAGGTLSAGAGGAVVLEATDATKGGIVLSGKVDASGGGFNISAGADGVVQTAGSQVLAGALASGGGVAGALTLDQAGNALGLIGDMAVGGNATLASSTKVSVVGTVAAGKLELTVAAADAAAIGVGATGALTATAGSSIALNASNPAGGIALAGDVNATATGQIDLAAGTGGITQTGGRIVAGKLGSAGGIGGTARLGSATNEVATLADVTIAGGDFALASKVALTVTGAIKVDPGRTIALAADTLTLAGTLTATAGTVEIAPISQSMSLGAANGSDLSLLQGDIDKIATGVLRLGAATGLGISADSVAVRASLDTTLAATTALRLDAGGSGITINAGTLKANALDLNTSGGGGVTAVAGTVVQATTLSSTAGITGDVALDASPHAIGTLGDLKASGALALASKLALDVTGKVEATAVALTGTAAGTAITVNGTVAAGTIALAASDPTGAIKLAGTLDAAASGTIDLTAGTGGVTQTGGSATAQTLASTGGVQGAVTLDGGGNAIARVGNAAITGGTFTLVSGVAVDVTGALSAPKIAITGTAADAKAIAVSGSVTVAAGGVVTLKASDAAGGIALSGSVDTGAAGTLDLSAGSPGVAQTGGAVKIGTLTSSTGIAGTTALTRSGNSIAVIGDIALSAGDLQVVNGAAAPVTVAGIASVAAGRLGLVSDALAITTGKLATGAGGTVEIAPLTRAMSLGAPNGTDLAILPTDLAGIATGTLRLGATTLGGFTAPSVTLRGSLDTSLAAPDGLRLDAGAGGIAFAAGTLKTPALDLATTGTVSQAGGLLAVGLLGSTTGIGGDVLLGDTANSINQLGKLVATGDLTVGAAGNLGITAAVTARDITLISLGAGLGALSVQPTGSLTAGSGRTITLKVGGLAGGIALAGAVDAGGTGIVDLNAPGGISQSGGTITAGLLRSTAGAGGDTKLTAAGNAIGTLGPFTVTGGSLALETTRALTAAGPVSATAIDLRSSAADAQAIEVTGKLAVAAGGTLALTASDAAGGIRLATDIAATGGVLDLTAGSAGVSQTAGTVVAGKLASSGGIQGDLALTLAGNKIAALGALAAKGDVTLFTTGALSIAGAASAGTGRTLSLSVDGLGFAAGGSLAAGGGVVEIGPLGAGRSIAMGTAAGDIAVGDLSKVSATVIRLGQAVTAGNPAQASSIASAGAVTPGADVLQLITSGAAAQATGGLVVDQLTGSVGSLDFAATGNKIANLGLFSATADVALASDSALRVVGPVTGANITLRSAAAGPTALDIAGAVQTAAGGTIALAATGATGGITLAGTVDATATGTLDLSAGSAGVTQTGGTLTAGVLRSTGGIGGGIALDQPGNSIGAVQDLAATGAFTLAQLTPILATGTVSATDITLLSAAPGAGAISVTGTLATTADGTITLTASDASGGLALAGKIDAGPGGTIALAAGSAGIGQTAGSLRAGSLQGNVAGGTATLDQPGNAIRQLDGFAVTGGSLTLRDAQALIVAGPVSADAITLRSSAAATKALDVTGSLAVTPGGTITLAATGGIALSGTVDATATGALDLAAGSAGIAQGGGSITAGTLRSTGGVAGTVVLDQPTNPIATLGPFAVTGGSFTLASTAPLTVAGPLSADAVTLRGLASGPTALSVPGSITAAGGGAISLQAMAATGGIALSGTVDAAGGALDLNAGSGGVTQTGGTLRAATLTGTATGAVGLGAAGNAIDAIGDVTVTGAGFTLVDSVALKVTGALAAGAVALTSSAAAPVALSIDGSITSATTAALTASDATGGIWIAGAVKAAILDLAAGSTGVQQTGGTIAATTLRSTAGVAGTVRLSEVGNAVAGVADFVVTTGDFSLSSDTPTDVTGALRALAGSVTVVGRANAANAVTLSGSIGAATSAILDAGFAPGGGIVLSGAVDTPALSLNAGTGGVSQTGGSLTTAALNGISSGAVALTRTTNRIDAVNGFTVAGADFTLANSVALVVRGLSAANGTLANTAAITIDGAIDVGAGILDLSTSAGGITQISSAITAGTLRSGGGVTGGVDLRMAGNAIDTVGPVTVTGGSFQLTSFRPLTVTGAVAAADIAVTGGAAGAAALAVTGTLNAAPGGRIDLTASDTGGGITLSGDVNASATGLLDLTAGSAGVSQTAGILTAGTLISSGGIAGTVTLDSAGNVIGGIGDLAVTGGAFRLTDSVAVTVGGTLAADSIRIADGADAVAAIAVSGTLRTAAGGSIALLAAGAGGGIALAGTLDATPTGSIDLSTGAGGIAQTAGSLAAGTLLSSAGVGGSVALDQPGNAVSALGPFALSAGSFSFTDAIALTVGGPVTVAAGDVALTSSAASSAAITVAADLTAAGTARLAATDPAGGIVLAAPVTAGTVDLSAGAGGVSQSGGALTATRLVSSGGVGGTVALEQPANLVASIGAFAVAGGDFLLTDAASLLVSGPLTASGAISLTGTAAGPVAIAVAGNLSGGLGRAVTLRTPAGGIAIAPGGTVAAPGGLLSLTAQTGIAGPGTVRAGELAVLTTLPGDVDLSGSGANAIDRLVGVSLADGSFRLHNAAALAITGPLTARLLGITATGRLSVADGVDITTEGLDRAAQGVAFPLSNAEIAALTTARLGSYLAVESSGGAPGTIDLGIVTVSPFGGASATLDLVLPSPEAGTITIDQLTARTTDLILVTRSGGVATGTIDTAGLLVLGGGGKTDLFGTIGGLGGPTAASKADIAPLPTAGYRLNACPITSINCVLLPVQTVPPTSPLRDLPIIRDRPAQDDIDVQLPNVSDEDY